MKRFQGSPEWSVEGIGSLSSPAWPLKMSPSPIPSTSKDLGGGVRLFRQPLLSRTDPPPRPCDLTPCYPPCPRL
jgi:hypothetical protein